MSESANVTGGVDIPEKPIPPVRKRKDLPDLEKEIDTVIENTSKRLLEATNSKYSIGDEVKINGRVGTVVTTSNTGKMKPHPAGAKWGSQWHSDNPHSVDSVTVKFANGKQEDTDPSKTHVEISKRNDRTPESAQWHHDDAATAKKQGQHARHDRSMGEYHRLMSAHFTDKGDTAQAKSHAEQSSKFAQSAQAREKDTGYPMKSAQAFRAENYGHNASTYDKRPRKHATFNHYYDIPFADRDKAKSMQFRWDPTKKKWYVNSHSIDVDEGDYLEVFGYPNRMSNDFETWMYEQLLVPNIEDGIGKLRHTMPQLSDFDSFMKDLADNKISMTTKPLTSTSLTPTQRNFNEEKVDRLVKSGTWDTKPIITSKDKYVIDGHHRWLAAVKLGKKILSRVVDMTCEDLLDFLKNKSYVETKTLRE